MPVRKASKTKRTSARAAEPAPGREVTKTKVIARLKALAPALVASGAIVDARHSSLETEPPPKRPKRAPAK